MNILLKPFERVKTIEGKVRLLLALLACVIGAYLVVRLYVRQEFGLGLDIATVLGLGLFTWILLAGLRQLVLLPLKRASRHVEEIGGGDYSTPIRTRRTDEFGDMFRALEQLRANLVAASAAQQVSDQLKADFVSFVTHQLRTPLAGIRWMLELAEQGKLEPDVATCVEDARLSAERLIALVNDLLDVVRLESGRVLNAPEPTAMEAIVREVVAELGPLAAAREQALTVDTGDVPLVLVDPQLARQAVVNFLSNAIKYTPERGAIHVSAGLAGNLVRLSVRDSGIGVPLAAQPHLFQKFFRAENAQVIDTEGTGLGLYLVRLIAQRSGGDVACESTEGEGSTFTLTLPVARERKAVA
jgi:signal transduction histidine kinase